MDAKQALSFVTSARGGVDRLRQLILSLAVRGLLVKQDSNDEPARVTFPRLAAVALDETEGDAFPKSWIRVQLGEIGEWRGGGTPSKSRPEYWKGDLPWVSPKDMKVLRISDAQDHISIAAVESSSVKLIQPGSILMVVRGMILSRAFPIAVTTREVTINQDMKALLPYEPAMKDFLVVVFRALEPNVLNAVEHSSHGTCKLKTDILHEFVIPVPPLSEQSRIVARVEELMKLCDELEARGALSDECHSRLVEATFGALAQSATPQEAVANWRRVTEHFPLLLDRPSAVDVLEKTVLSLAVRGLLVPQDPQDEPASALLEKVRAEKVRLAKEGKIRKDKPLPEISEDEKPFPVPEGWGWTRLGVIADIFTGDSLNAGEKAIFAKTTSGYPYIATKDVGYGFAPINYENGMSAENSDGKYKIAPVGTVFICAEGGSAGKKMGIVDRDVLFGNKLFANIPFCKIRSHYLLTYFGTDIFWEEFTSRMTGIIGGVPGKDFKEIPIPLPPLAEQSRIVARVEELMGLCAQLRAALQKSDDTGEQLADALATQVLAA